MARVSEGAEEVVAREELQQARKALAELQEEARRNGVPPGWLRGP